MASDHSRRIPVQISPDVLDQIGKDFRFNHAKGLVEWLKNSLDAYLVRRAEEREEASGGWPVYMLLADGARNRGPNLAVLDFAGASHADVQDFLLKWFSTSAATRGARATEVGLTGGHGNGGKFYMREMWRADARFCTYLNQRVSSLVVDRATDGTCGYWEHEDAPMAWRDALAIGLRDSGIAPEQLIDLVTATDPSIISDLESGARGFTILVGRSAVQVKSSNDVVSGRLWKVPDLIDGVRAVPAALRPLRELSIRVCHNGRLGMERLSLLQVDEDPNWAPEVSILPPVLPDPDDESATIRLTASDDPDAGTLTVRKANTPLAGRLRIRNQITVLDAASNPVGAFAVPDLRVGGADYARFLFGELQVRFKEIEDYVENDRESFRNAPQIDALRSWLRERLSSYVQRIDDELKKDKKQQQLELAAALNNILNDYASRFLDQLETEMFVDWLDEEGGGEGGDGGNSGGSKEGKRGAGGGAGTGGGRRDQPGTADRVRRPRFPRILLSGYDIDPSSADGGVRVLSDTHPPISQNEDDLRVNVWWINTSHPYAAEALNRGGPSGRAWKEYHFFMFRDVVQLEHLRMLQRRDAELSLDVLENELIETSGDFLRKITQELAEHILDE